MSLRFVKARASLAACRSSASEQFQMQDAKCKPGRSGTCARFASCMLHFAFLSLALPATADAQRGPFFSAVVAFYRSSAGLYGDEGPQLVAQLAAMSTALDRWDQEIRDAERELRSRLQSDDDVQTTLQIHTTLASLYVERGRLSDAAREFDEDISIDPRRAVFHRLKGLVLQATSRHVEAANAF